LAGRARSLRQALPQRSRSSLLSCRLLGSHDSVAIDGDQPTERIAELGLGHHEQQFAAALALLARHLRDAALRRERLPGRRRLARKLELFLGVQQQTAIQIELREVAVTRIVERVTPEHEPADEKSRRHGRAVALVIFAAGRAGRSSELADLAALDRERER